MSARKIIVGDPSEEMVVPVAGRGINIARVLGDINMDNLVREVSESNGFSVWFAWQQAEADTEVERAKQRLEYREAEIAHDFRLEQTRLERKITENMVNECLVMNQEVRELKDSLIEAQRRAGIMRGVSMAVNQKARTLEKMTFLIGNEHGAGEAMREKMCDDAKRSGGLRKPV